MRLFPCSRLLAVYLLLLLLGITPCRGAISVNLPLDDPAYALLEKLTTGNLTFSNALTSKPITRLYAARLIAEAIQTHRQARDGGQPPDPFIEQILQHLTARFKPELRQIGFMYQPRPPAALILAPPDDVKLDLIGAYKPFVQRDQRGNLQGVFSHAEGFTYGADASMRLRVASHGILWQHLAAYIEPEVVIRSDPILGDRFEFNIHKGYLKTAYFNLELQLGRDTVGWGPAAQGDLILSPNAPPLNLLKLSTSTPFRLPWLYRDLGELQMTYFVARLEDSRAVSHALVSGFRATFQPTSYLQFGYTSAIQAYGKKGISLDAADYIADLFAPPINNKADSANGLVAYDVVLSFPFIREIPFLHGAKFYWQRGQDSSRDMRGLLRGGNILGGMLDGGRWDIRIEFAETRDRGATWYTHPRYQSGFTFKRFFLGHPIGGDAESIFGRATYYLRPTTWAAVDGRREQYDVTSQATRTTQYRLGVEASHLLLLQKRHLVLWGRLEYAALDRPQADLKHAVNVRLAARLRF